MSTSGLVGDGIVSGYGGRPGVAHDMLLSFACGELVVVPGRNEIGNRRLSTLRRIR